MPTAPWPGTGSARRWRGGTRRRRRVRICTYVYTLGTCVPVPCHFAPTTYIHIHTNVPSSQSGWWAACGWHWTGSTPHWAGVCVSSGGTSPLSRSVHNICRSTPDWLYIVTQPHTTYIHTNQPGPPPPPPISRTILPTAASPRPHRLQALPQQGGRPQRAVPGGGGLRPPADQPVSGGACAMIGFVWVMYNISILASVLNQSDLNVLYDTKHKRWSPSARTRRPC